MTLSQKTCKALADLGVKTESQFWWRLSYYTSESFDNGKSLGKKGVFGDYAVQYLPKPRFRTADIKWNEHDLSKLNETELPAYTLHDLPAVLKQVGKIKRWDELPDGRKWDNEKYGFMPVWKHHFIRCCEAYAESGYSAVDKIIEELI